MADTLQAAEVVVPTSLEDAASAFGDGSEVTVIAGGTIVVPEIAHGRLRPRRALLLNRAGLAGVRTEDGRVTVGAMTPVAELEGLASPLGDAARHVADVEIRRQATLGGNLCAPPGVESPRGDLQAALIALGAEVRSTGAGGERTEGVEDFLGAADRLVLDVRFAEPEAGAHSSVRRPHAHAYTIMSVCAARSGGEVRIAVAGAGPRAVRLRAAEAAFAGGDAAAAAARALDDVTPPDDALASAWYRAKTLPVLVRRALTELSQ
jgi:CO/xanthine dehydrogenase FAD-binding subunit